MRRRPTRAATALGVLTLLTTTGIVGVVGCLGQAGENERFSSWSRLELKAHAFPLTGRVTMTMRRDADRHVLGTETTARFLGARIANSSSESVLDAATGETREYTSRSSKRARRFVFDDTGYTATKYKPGPAEDGGVVGDGDFAGWHVAETRHFDRPADEAGRALPMYDYYGMLMRLGREPLNEPGDEVTLWVATNDGAQPYTIAVGEATRGEYEWKDGATGADHREMLRAFRLRILPADPEQADEGFLDMEGETEVWVEARSKTLLHLSGKVPKVPGRVRLALDVLN